MVAGISLAGIGVVGFVCSLVYERATRTEGVGPLVNYFLLSLTSAAVAGSGILLVIIDLLWRLVRHYRKPAQ